MPSSANPSGTAAKRHRPSTVTVFASAFVAGAAAAFGINQALDKHLAQNRPQVECDPIFVALHALPQGAPVTVWDVALRDWPRAMLPTTALGPHDSFEGMVLRHPLREGQPLLAVQLMPSAAVGAPAEATRAHESFTPPTPAATGRLSHSSQPDRDLWATDGSGGDIGPSSVGPRQPTNVAMAVAPSVTAVEAPVIPAPQPAASEPAAESKPEALVAVLPQSPQPSPAPAAPVQSAIPSTVSDDVEAATATPVVTQAADEVVVSAPVEVPVEAKVESAPAQIASEPRSGNEPTLAEPPAAEPPADLTATPGLGQTPLPDRSEPLPLVAPVPMSPSTDIERPLAAVTVPRSPPEQKPEPKAQSQVGPQAGTKPDLAATPEPAKPTEPTEADGVSPKNVVSNPVATDSVLVAPQSEPELAGVPPQPAEPRSPPVRYLVVPERIALQADSSFVPHAPPQTSAAADYATHDVQALPATAGEAPTRVPQTQTKPVARPDRQPAKPTSPPRNRVSRALGGWFPGFTGGTPAPTQPQPRPGQSPAPR